MLSLAEVSREMERSENIWTTNYIDLYLKWFLLRGMPNWVRNLPRVSLQWMNQDNGCTIQTYCYKVAGEWTPTTMTKQPKQTISCLHIRADLSIPGASYFLQQKGTRVMRFRCRIQESMKPHFEKRNPPTEAMTELGRARWRRNLHQWFSKSYATMFEFTELQSTSGKSTYFSHHYGLLFVWFQS